MRLPLRIQIVILFFAIDGVEKAFTLGASVAAAWPDLSAETMRSPGFIDAHFPLVLALLFDLLLAVMLALRTRAGRFWGIIYLVSLTAVSVALLVVEPGRWIELGQRGRLQELATYAVNLGLAAILLGETARRTLLR